MRHCVCEDEDDRDDRNEVGTGHCWEEHESDESGDEDKMTGMD